MKRIGRILMIAGMICILIPISGRSYIQHKQDKLYAAYLEKVESTLEQSKEMETSISKDLKPSEVQEADHKINGVVDKNKVNEVVDKNIEEMVNEISQEEVIGKIVIDKINVNLIVLEGTSDKALGLGAGHMKDTAWPGRVGNCVIAGHRNYTFGSMFNRLGEVKVGDEVKIEFQNENYSYKVNEIKIVEPNDQAVLEQDESKKELTLITCHPMYTGTHRMIIKGLLVE